ncbi:MAG: hypothetical protein EPN21_06470 [Methylococcaceae bacterium]|nr:MAG: hypothetical protein EPN21_06470 [Methylococcaceae bacterium]
MDQQLKTRLIGATIIMSLLVIFVPMLFEDSGEQTADVSTASAPEFPQEFDSQALPLPSAAPKSSAAAPMAGAGSEMQSLPAPSRDEPLDPLDVQQPAAVTGQTDDMAGLEPTDSGADFAPAKLPAARPAAKAPVTADVEPPPLPREAAARPVIAESKPVEKPKPVVIKEPAAKAPAPAKAKAAPAPVPAKPASAEKAAGKLSAWVVQAGSFSDEANAKTLVAKLRQAKIPAFMEMVPGPQGNSYRVRVGPEVERAKAEVILKKMDSDAGVKGMIVSYP